MAFRSQHHSSENDQDEQDDVQYCVVLFVLERLFNAVVAAVVGAIVAVT